MSTMQDVVDLARIPLNDSNADDTLRRYPDAELLKYATHGMLNAYRKRYDLFVGGITPPSLSTALTDVFPLSDTYIQPLADWVVFRAESKDDEYVNTGRLQAMAQIFTAEVPQ